MKFEQFNFSNKKAIIRVDFNVPLNDKFEITDDTRIRAAIPTIKKIINDGGSAILMSHLGRPKNGPEDKFSLRYLLSDLSDKLGVTVKFADDCIGNSAVDLAGSLEPGQVLLLENLRFYKEETRGDETFARKLADLADIYVNDAFGTAHRAHASTTIIAQYFKDKMFGYVIEGELSSIDKVLHEANGPFTAIIGGAKVSTKITIIEKLLDKVDHLIIGGGMMFTFAKAQGAEVGSSLIEEDKLDLALKILSLAKEKSVTIHLPSDTKIADAFDNNANTRLCEVKSIDKGWMGLDIGPASIQKFTDIIEMSNTVLWNGPMGVFEMTNFRDGTKAVAEALVNCTVKGGFSLIGGGDSVAAINLFDMSEKVSYVSTGGGALLEYMEGKELPGIAAIRNNQ
jgi:phosphoglycerate kinase